jgi:hypothetical protein
MLQYSKCHTRKTVTRKMETRKTVPITRKMETTVKKMVPVA